jgi:hypothetical protein
MVLHSEEVRKRSGLALLKTVLSWETPLSLVFLSALTTPYEKITENKVQ